MIEPVCKCGHISGIDDKHCLYMQDENKNYKYSLNSLSESRNLFIVENFELKSRIRDLENQLHNK